MLDDAKKLLGINHSEFDSIISGFIRSGKEDLASVGIAHSLIDTLDTETPNDLIKTAVLTYVLSQIDEDNREGLTESYEKQKDSLRRKTAYQEGI